MTRPTTDGTTGTGRDADVRPLRTPNPATAERPERSSVRVAHKRPLGWLPWALLGLLALLLALALLAVGLARGNDDDATTSAPVSTPPVATAPAAGAPAGLSPAALTALAAAALVGGGTVDAGPADATSGDLTAAREAGTAGTVLFDEGSATVDAEGRQVVSAAARALRSSGARSVEVVGFTDVVAGAPVNTPLSQQRADAVASELRAQLPGVTVTTSARGQDSPVASNTTEQGRQQNRRAAVVARG